MWLLVEKYNPRLAKLISQGILKEDFPISFALVDPDCWLTSIPTRKSKHLIKFQLRKINNKKQRIKQPNNQPTNQTNKQTNKISSSPRPLPPSKCHRVSRSSLHLTVLHQWSAQTSSVAKRGKPWRKNACLPYKVFHTVDGRNPAPVEVCSLSHYFQGFIHTRCCTTWG